MSARTPHKGESHAEAVNELHETICNAIGNAKEVGVVIDSLAWALLTGLTCFIRDEQPKLDMIETMQELGQEIAGLLNRMGPAAVRSVFDLDDKPDVH